ncbi:hypothetical protein N7492_007617 [Penicillium capsulatum]|uniref:Uncharacterized protein n=1 Tax=Penicillium capsulatum TaxID=69766 RepID=A0A9W9I4A3_9EURO|nr:hypothetical protein N7492_007617 [Penicillium capsulatum]
MESTHTIETPIVESDANIFDGLGEIPGIGGNSELWCYRCNGRQPEVQLGAGMGDGDLFCGECKKERKITRDIVHAALNVLKTRMEVQIDPSYQVNLEEEIHTYIQNCVVAQLTVQGLENPEMQPPVDQHDQFQSLMRVVQAHFETWHQGSIDSAYQHHFDRHIQEFVETRLREHTEARRQALLYPQTELSTQPQPQPDEVQVQDETQAQAFSDFPVGALRQAQLPAQAQPSLYFLAEAPVKPSCIPSLGRSLNLNHSPSENQAQAPSDLSVEGLFRCNKCHKNKPAAAFRSKTGRQLKICQGCRERDHGYQNEHKGRVKRQGQNGHRGESSQSTTGNLNQSATAAEHQQSVQSDNPPAEPATVKCTRCGAQKPRSEFMSPSDKQLKNCADCRSKDRVSKASRSERSQSMTTANPQSSLQAQSHPDAPDGIKCTTCHEFKPTSEFREGNRQFVTCTPCRERNRVARARRVQPRPSAPTGSDQ